VQMTWFSSC